MFTLRVLGGLRLENGSQDQSGRATQRRRLALLALLGLTPTRRMTRDRAVAILWPEVTAEEGRARLSSALYDLRRLLGDTALGSHGDEIWIEPSALRIDAVEFLAAARRGSWQEAESLYAGPLLDGVHLPDSNEFEEWLAGRRDELQRQFVVVLERLAESHEAHAQWSEALERWRRLTQLDPLSSRWTARLMRALARAGERAEALRTAERFSSRLREDLGVAGDPDVERLSAELRAAPRLAAPAQPLALPAPLTEPAPAGVTTLTPLPPAVPQRAAPRHLIAVALALLLVLFGSAALLLSRRTARGTALPASHPLLRIAVLPFSVTGDSSLAFLADGLVDLLSADLDGLGNFAAVDPHALLARAHRERAQAGSRPARELAAQLGSGRYVVGSVYGLRDSVRIQATLYATATGSVLREARASGPLTTVPSLVDALTAQFAAGELQSAGDRVASIAARTTLSIPALREFLAGEAHFRQGRFGPAIEAYGRAVTEDTTFALAHYRLALAILWGNHPGASTEYHDSLALLHAARLSPRDRALVEAYAAWRAGRAADALQRYTVIAERHPDDVEAWYQLGETLFHYSPQLGRSIAEARIPFERVVALDSIHWGARWHLALLDAKDGRPAALRDQVKRLLALHPDSQSALEMQLTAGVGPDGAAPRAEGVGELVLFGAGWRRAVFLEDAGGAAQLFQVMAEPARSPYSRLLGFTALGELSLARGQWVVATEQLRHAQAYGIPHGRLLQVLFAVTPGFERPRAERDSLEAWLAQWLAENPADPAKQAEAAANGRTLLGYLHAARGDAAGAETLARQVDSLARSSPDSLLLHGWAHAIRAYVAHASHRDAVALAELDAGRQTSWYGIAVTSMGRAQTFERFLRAEVLRGLGRDAEALGWYGGFAEHAVQDLMFLAPVLLRSAQLNEKLGRPALAAEQYGKAAALWRDADSVYRGRLRREGIPTAAVSAAPAP